MFHNTKDMNFARKYTSVENKDHREGHRKVDITCITTIIQKIQNRGDENIFSDIQPLQDLPEIKTKPINKLQIGRD